MILRARLQVSRDQIKIVKTAIQLRNKLLKPLEIRKDGDGACGTITIVFDYDVTEATYGERDESLHDAIFQIFQIQDLKDKVKVIELCESDHLPVDQSCSSRPRPDSQTKAITNAVSSWLHTFEAPMPKGLNHDMLIGSANIKRYQIYPPMLLFSTTAFSSPSWQHLFQAISEEVREELWKCIATMMGVTHIAVNAPIPLHNIDGNTKENNIRSPTNLQPLYGDFGPLLSTYPTSKDFEAAFWVSTVQNGITQTWAPRYTMFSRGNVTEKTRILHHTSVAEAVTQGQVSRRGNSAVDLYAGIGYFAFSYVKAGVNKVFCFEINPWSVEGLKRGAICNGWTVQTVNVSEAGSTTDACIDPKIRLLILPTSNEHADEIMAPATDTIPPVRHVNCGLLPSSRNSWKVALSVLDSKEGGWIHIHENMAMTEIEQSSQAILKDLELLTSETRPLREQAPVLEHIERVKTFAPGVMHCVLDVYIPPITAK